MVIQYLDFYRAKTAQLIHIGKRNTNDKYIIFWENHHNFLKF